MAESGVSKINYKNFKYNLPYDNCKGKSDSPITKADGLDTFYLKDGTSFKAKMIEQFADGTLKVELPDGKMQTYQMVQIEKIVRGVM